MHKTKFNQLKAFLFLFIINLVCFLNARANGGGSGINTPSGGGTGVNTQSSQSTSGGLFDPLGNLTFFDLIKKIAQFAAKIGLPVAAVFIIYSGFLFVTARGSEDKIKTARQTFTWTIVGTAILVGAWVIVGALQGTIEALQ